MKVLFLDTRPIRRGAQIFIHDLKGQFEKRGVDVERFFLYRETKFETLPLEENDFVLNFKENHWMEKWVFFQPRLCLALLRSVRKFNPDIILCNGSRTLKYAALVKVLTKGLKAKWIYRVIDSAKYWNNRTFTTIIYRSCIIPAMDASVGVSEKSLLEMIQHYSFNKPSAVIPRAVDIAFFESYRPDCDLRKKWQIDNNAFVILFLGNFTKQKRPDRFLHVIAELKSLHPYVHGLMVGDGPLKKDMMSKSEDLNLTGSITFTGYQQDVRPFIAMCDLLMLTSDTEGMPGVVLEAAAMKCVSVCTDVGGVKEFIENDKIGFVLSTPSVNNFVFQIDRLIVNKSFISKTANNAFLQVSKKYSLRVVVNQYLEFFNSLLTYQTSN